MSFVATLVSLLFLVGSCGDKDKLAPIPTQTVTPPPATSPRAELALDPADYTELIWNDEFNGPSVDPTKWEMEVGDKWFNNELQAYTNSPTNAFTQGGNLVIQAKKEQLRQAQYTSARLRTKGKGDWTYGKIEVRAKLPKGQGIWPAIWMLPTDDKFGGWPKSGEIDIMELRGQTPRTTLGTVHFGKDWPNNKHKGAEYTLPAGDFSQDFHVFSVIWSKDRIRWYVDGNQFLTITPSDLGNENYPFNNRFHMLLNVAVGGDFLGNPDGTTEFPAQMLVDYVRIYHPK